MQINRETIKAGLEQLVENMFRLPEIAGVKVRDVIIERDEIRSAKIEEAVEKSYHDCLSDIDLTAIVRISPKDEAVCGEYVRRIDRIGITDDVCLGCSREGDAFQRIVLKNGLRYDLGFEFEWDDAAERICIEPKNEEASNPAWPMENVNRFWFIQIQALGKLYRNDYLISSHLANMNLNDTLVQQMVLRDIQYGTNHHRYGYKEELSYEKNKNQCKIQSGDDVFDLIADKICCAAITHDRLTKVFYPEYDERTSAFMEIWDCYEANRRQQC